MSSSIMGSSEMSVRLKTNVNSLTRQKSDLNLDLYIPNNWNLEVHPLLLLLASKIHLSITMVTTPHWAFTVA